MPVRNHAGFAQAAAGPAEAGIHGTTAGTRPRQIAP